MKKVSFIYFLIAIICSSLLKTVYAETSIKQYRGFPVYPPEQIEQFSKESLDKITTKTNLSDFKNAEKYILEKAPLCGWQLLYEDIFRDGGSKYFLFGNKNDKVNLVRVFNWSGGGMIIADSLKEAEEKFKKEIYTIEYQFETFAAPIEYQGFPLPSWIKSLSDCQISKDIKQNTELVVSYEKETEIYNNSFWELYLQGALPKLYGWKKNNFIIPEESVERNLVHEISFFVKDNQIVKLKRERLFDDKGEKLEKTKIYITFFSTAESVRLLASFPENPYKEIIVENPAGAFILNGRYIRPPYKLELKDYCLYVNGNLYEDKPREPGSFLLLGLQQGADGLKGGVLYNYYESGSSQFGPAEGVKNYLASIDSIMKSNLPPEEKKRKLQELEGITVVDADLILKNWDGIE